MLSADKEEAIFSISLLLPPYHEHSNIHSFYLKPLFTISQRRFPESRITLREEIFATNFRPEIRQIKMPPKHFFSSTEKWKFHKKALKNLFLIIKCCIKKVTLAQVFSSEFCEILRALFLQNTSGRILRQVELFLYESIQK